MILAAGFGTRLGELTRDRPKALIPVGGVPVLDRVVGRLAEAGVDRLIINLHHHAELIERHVEERGGYGMEVVFSREVEQPLETGGALLHARSLFRHDGPFLLHNADVVTDLPLEDVLRQHRESNPLATVVVMRRESSRALLFDDRGLLGRVDDDRQIRLELRPPTGSVLRLGFSGIHVVSPAIFPLIEERGVFSILEPYLRLSGLGYRIDPFHADEYRWIDIGRPDQLREASAWLERSLP
jgi:NDP-sugar pyrophosphorylase family protein